MPFPRKVWIGLLLPRTCTVGYRTSSQVKQRPWKDDMPSFLTQIFQDWGSRVSCVLTRGWDKETQGSLRKTWAWSEQEAVVFVCLLWWEAGPARLHACRQDVTWGGVCSWEAFSESLWCQLPRKFSLSPLPATDPHGAILGWWAQRSSRSGALWGCLVYTMCSLCLYGQQNGEVGKICLPCVSPSSIQFPFLCFPRPLPLGFLLPRSPYCLNESNLNTQFIHRYWCLITEASSKCLLRLKEVHKRKKNRQLPNVQW